MSEIVFILGAGASKRAGAPLMLEFLDTADDVRKGDLSPDDKRDFDLVFSARAELQQVHSKAQLDILNLESVFAAFEMAKLLGQLGSLTEEEINRLPTAMRNLIVKTLEQSIHLPVSGGRIIPPRPYGHFVELLSALLKARRTVSVLTLNYDLCLDYALHFHGMPIDYCLSGPSGTRSVKILKLHGSLNWFQCPSCQKVVDLKLSEYFTKFRLSPFLDTSTVKLKLASNIQKFSHCPESPAEGVFIIPPTWNKAQYYEQLGNTWKAAAVELKDAEYIYVIGFSLPDTDYFFRHFYALASIGPAPLKQFYVFNPDEVVERRFRGLLGQQADSRFEFFEERFRDAIPKIAALHKTNTQ